MGAKIDLNAKKIADLGARTPLFPYEAGSYKLQVHKFFKHDTTVKEDGTFNPYGSESYRVRVSIVESTNAKIRPGNSYLLMFGVFDKGFKGEKAAGKLFNLLAAVDGEVGNPNYDANAALNMYLDKELDGVHVSFARANRVSEMKDGTKKTFTDEDSFDVAS